MIRPAGSSPMVAPGGSASLYLRPAMRRAGSGGVAAIAGACLVSGAILFVDAVLVEPDWIEVAHHLEYVPGWRRSAPDVVLVHLSDPHVEGMGRRERRAIDAIVAARPDLIAITGDLVRRGRDPGALEGFLAALPRNRTFAVWGNHDHASGFAGAAGADLLGRAGVVLLDNTHQRIRTSAGTIVVAGVDDPSSGLDNLARALDGVARREFTLLLSHSPEIAGALGNRDVDLMLSGHTHGGQVRMPLLGAILLPAGTASFEDGWFDVDGGARLHVSRGLGWSGLPIRFLCRPRIDVITLRGGAPPAPPHRRRSNAA